MSEKPLILAVETSGRSGSVAIGRGEEIFGESAFSGPMRHSAELFPAISDLLERFSRKTSEIEHIYISSGPGSFTGLRIAATLAKTMHLANAVKIVAVDTLDVIAANVSDYLTCSELAKPNEQNTETGLKKIATILDAKRGQFFIAAYRKQSTTTIRKESTLSSSGRVMIKWEKILPDCIMTAAQFVDRFTCKEEPIWLLGEGLVYHKDKFKAEGICFLDECYWTPKASKVYLLGKEKASAGEFADALTLQPTYLQRPDVKEKHKMKQRPKAG